MAVVLFVVEDHPPWKTVPSASCISIPQRKSGTRFSDLNSGFYGITRTQHLYQVGFSWIHEGTVPALWISRRPRLLIGGALFAMPLPLVREPSTFISISSHAI